MALAFLKRQEMYSLKRLINAICQYRKCKLTYFQDICRYIPAHRFVALKIFDNLLHIIYRIRLKWKFTSNIKFFRIFLMLGCLRKLSKMLSIPSPFVYHRRTLILEQTSFHLLKFSYSTKDQKCRLNILATSLFLKTISSFSFNIMSVSALLCLFEK